MPTKKPGRDSRSKKTPSKPTAPTTRRPARGGNRVSVGRDLRCADFVGRDKTITYNYAPASLERLIARLLEFLEGGAVFQLQGDRLAAELNGETLAFRPGAIGSLMHRRSPRAYWLGLIVDPQHCVWSTLFVPLKATADVAQVPLEIRLNYREYFPASGPETQPRNETLEDITEVVRKHRAFVIVGDPGAGKTTTLRKLALDHARAALANDPELPAPFFVRLSQQGEQSPYEFLSAQWHQCTGGDFGDALVEGGLLILADGLNELPRASEVRRARLKAWREFVQDDAGRNQFVFTSRERGEYAGELDLPNVRVEPLDVDRIDEYARRWKAEGLLPYLKDPKSRLGELARNPFYLNLLVHAHHEDAALLANRGRLLRQFVRRLWEREERQARKDWIATSVQDQALSALAYAMQVKGVNLTLAAQDAATLLPPSVDVNDDEPVHVKPMALFRLARAELLLDPVLETEVRFYHQLLQEYFAAEALLVRFESGVDLGAQWRGTRRSDEMSPVEVGNRDPLPEPPGTGWEETTILACGLAEIPEHLVTAVRAHNANLAARCWLESGVVWGPTRDESHKPRLQKDLLAEIYDLSMHLRTRLQAGHTLGWLGDPRFVAYKRDGVSFIPPNLIPVPAGRYRIDSSQDDPSTGMDGCPQRIVELADFAIGKWPVTSAEFACFIRAGGYDDERWWRTGLDKAWMRGRRDYASAKERATMFPDVPQFREVPSQPPPPRTQAVLLGPSSPVTRVTWFEARAYCAWLTAASGSNYRLPTSDEWEATVRGTEDTVPTVSGMEYRLPMSGEWEVDARFTGDTPLTWGPEWKTARSMGPETLSMYPSPVGAYAGAEGRGYFGAEDQLGNTWEWTSSLQGESSTTSGGGEFGVVMCGGRASSDEPLIRRFAPSPDVFVKNNCFRVLHS